MSYQYTENSFCKICDKLIVKGKDMTTKEKIEVMQAHLDGKDIECRESGEHEWENINTKEPVWNWVHFDYRIKRRPREFKLQLFKDGTGVVGVAPNYINTETIRVREIL
jgi:hypothetical protein